MAPSFVSLVVAAAAVVGVVVVEKVVHCKQSAIPEH